MSRADAYDVEVRVTHPEYERFVRPVAFAVEAALASEAAGRSLGVVVLLVSDAEIAMYHEQFLGVSGPTDVISWPAAPPQPEDASSASGASPALRAPAASTLQPRHPEWNEGFVVPASRTAEPSPAAQDEAAVLSNRIPYRSPTDGPAPSPGAEHDLDPDLDSLPSPISDHSLGDVMVSCETARAQAEELGHSWEREVCVLAVHGVLHLLGWDDLAPGAQAAMQAQVDEIVDGMEMPGM